MFTGLITARAALVSLEKKDPPVLTLRVALDKPPAVGDSVAIDGICLTLIGRQDDLLRFQLAAPTLRLSNLQDRPAGSALNVELPLTLNGLVGGHLVSGHIDGIVRLRAARRGAGRSRFEFTYSQREWRKFLVPRGSVALNGVSLTVSELHDTWLGVDLIPQTLASTNLGLLRPGDRANIELDLIGKYLYNFSRTEKGRIR
ncbi:MAG: riboflavin synthase [Candidatus Aminicenantes bacterium]|nr:riboflavin synthase [Candidatus Aminicenantes bacterium]